MQPYHQPTTSYSRLIIPGRYQDKVGGHTRTSDILPLDWSIAHTSVMERPRAADESASASDAATTDRAGRDVASESSLVSFVCERKFQFNTQFRKLHVEGMLHICLWLLLRGQKAW